MNLSSELLQRLRATVELSPELPIWIAYSGGLDSTALLHLAVEAGLPQQVQLAAIHVHHGLQPEADAWAKHCQAQCDALGVGFKQVQAELELGTALEERARDARYRIFTELMNRGGLLLQAHHADDQAETLLFRMLRASGVRGLGGIPAQRVLGNGQLLRPLLEVTRQQLQQYAEVRQLCWVEDPSNVELVHNRNFLRAQVMPVLQQRWPALAKSFTDSARHCQQAQQLCDDLAQLDLQDAEFPGAGLSLQQLESLPAHRRWNLLRYWLHRVAVLPSEMQLQKLWQDLAGARNDAQPSFQLGQFWLRRYRGGLFVLPDRPPIDPHWRLPVELVTGQDHKLRLPQGQLVLQPSTGQGLKLAEGAQVELRLRQGGERICLPGREGSRSLKKLLQQAGLPPWLREQLPLIYVDDQLAAVADLWLAEGFEATDQQLGWLLRWDSSDGSEKLPI